MSSVQNMGKKMAEEMELDQFLEAYEYATGRRLMLLRSEEHPDFVCVRQDGTHVGVELTRGEGDVKVMEHMRRDLGEPDFGYLALDDVFFSIEGKERLRQSNWTLQENSILVVQMFFHSLKGAGTFLTPDLQSDFDQHGFAEIWLADYTTVEPYGVVELFGLKPAKWWGHHPCPYFLGKPYG